MKKEETHLDYDKMLDHVNLNHPREIVKNEQDGTIRFEKLPLCTPVGEIMTSAFIEDPEWVPFDQLGIGVTLYFKMVKIMIIILTFATILCLPYMFVFAKGNEATTAMGLEHMFGTYSLGNIGQSKDKCSFQDINNCDNIVIRCPNNTIIS